METQDYLANQSYKGLDDWAQIVEIKIARSYMAHEFQAMTLRAGYKSYVELAHDYGMAKKGVPYCRIMVSRAANGLSPNLRCKLIDFVKANPKVRS